MISLPRNLAELSEDEWCSLAERIPGLGAANRTSVVAGGCQGNGPFVSAEDPTRQDPAR